MAVIWNFVVSRCEVTNRETLEPIGSLKRSHFITDHLPNFRLSQVAQDFSNLGPALADGKISNLYIFFNSLLLNSAAEKSELTSQITKSYE